jgi:hypothetical protein
MSRIGTLLSTSFEQISRFQMREQDLKQFHFATSSDQTRPEFAQN